jgi:hypothetical protein
MVLLFQLSMVQKLPIEALSLDVMRGSEYVLSQSLAAQKNIPLYS